MVACSRPIPQISTTDSMIIILRPLYRREFRPAGDALVLQPRLFVYRRQALCPRHTFPLAQFSGCRRWEHKARRFQWHQNLYCSTFGSTFGMTMTRISAKVPSSITETGTRGHGAYDFGGSVGMRLLMGASASHISGIPQWASVDGYATVAPGVPIGSVRFLSRGRNGGELSPD